MFDIFLLEGIREKNEAALCRLIDKYTAYVCRIIANVTNGQLSHEDIEEVASDVFFALWENAAGIRGNLKGYLGAVARNKGRNKLRQMTEDIPLVDSMQIPDCDDFEESILGQEEKKLLQSAIQTLQDTDRDIFIRHYYNDQTVEKIAIDTGMGLSAVKQRLVRGREKLRAILGKEFE